MILKEKDSPEAHLKALRATLSRAKTDFERRKSERALALASAGVEGEREAAYHIDFHLKDSRNWMVIHDLRVEWEGRVAQIDHLIINRMLELYVVESKNFKTKVRYENGGFERLDGRSWEGFPCPVEQNRRHILVLKGLIEARSIVPTRLGVSLLPSYINVIAVHPACSVVGNFPNDARVWKMDGLAREFQNDVSNPLALLSLVAIETLETFARKLVSLHCPSQTARRASVMELRDAPSDATIEPKEMCEGCGKTVAKDEAHYCRMNKGRFAGKLLCRKCQEFAPKAVATAEAAGWCVECGEEVDNKVVAFCRFNSKRFEKRILCRSCQATIK